ncbi:MULTISPECIES: NADH:flavin oxidoreductase/NADH oxidase [Shewanella]|jgi:2,4-dienoyl-CoA reductase-like NADH-dependent reductase (Old Yellow Enzyme family)|uniref:2,4-dienoyl-CoA reductase-like NADH-dependent reductase (Old Yellow Enzyme family) n=1 Tax=Shewanella fodinae TaxID=552357 RepID=A0A4R2F7Y3_9GAMM|nr:MULTISPECIES: NADH:flavin oxidoreductase/NADH oxidase [Shewanella]MBO1272565.1 NADH:flavin oxidoreductase/NADH oxidase [Shewanella sp. 4t3-1-2LB]TCN79608.1 2,4-dienoyl-CoA reductase-like NADH-dependent reductase (Old Yellow Enzyme family) [Shewanella fodinae]
MTAIFSPYTLKGVTLRNRIAVPPMCQYSAVNGYTTDWHEAHYAAIARGGAGLVIVEATGVSPEGRITPACTGLWEDGQIQGMARVAKAIKASGAVPGIQIGHAGRKASANRPWEGDDHIPSDQPNGWDTIAPSAIAFGGGLSKVPQAMTLDDIQRVKADFVAAAQRALTAGFEWLELHFAHGYLAQNFFSRVANQRTDAYGGDFVGRSRFLLETLQAVREVWPEHLPLTARFGVIEFDGHDEETLAESIELARQFKHAGLDMLNVSMGFSTQNANVPWGPGFMVPIAAKVGREAELAVATGWCLDNPLMAEKAVADKQIELVMIGRAHLVNPHYPMQIAQALGVEKPASVLPEQYAYWLSRYHGSGTGSSL